MSKTMGIQILTLLAAGLLVLVLLIAIVEHTLL